MEFSIFVGLQFDINISEDLFKSRFSTIDETCSALHKTSSEAATETPQN